MIWLSYVFVEIIAWFLLYHNLKENLKIKKSKLKKQ